MSWAIGRYHLLGHSMGGAIVQEIALRDAGGRLLSLTLHDTSDSFGHAFNNPNLAVWVNFRHKVAEEQGMLAVSNLNSPFPPPPYMPAERTAETACACRECPFDSFIGAWQGLSEWPGTIERAAAIKAPTLVIYGDLDAGFLIDASKRLAATISGAELAAVPEAAHSPQFERPQLFNAALGAFLNMVSGER